MMPAVNLIPVQRRERAQRKRRARAWALGISSYAATLSVTYAVLAGAWATDDRPLVEKLARIPNEISDTNRRIDELQTRLRELQSKLNAMRAIADQPDWAILLSVLGREVGQEAALSELSLEPIAAGEIARSAVPSTRPAVVQGYALAINGVARSQSAVSQFVLRLEQIGLFDRVQLVKSSRTTLGEGEATAFRVEASIRVDEPAKE
jgi:Tfp pilus assembly protein PilN